MLYLQGYGTSSGVGDGPIHLYTSPHKIPEPSTVTDTEAELSHAEDALAAVRDELLSLHQRALDSGIPPESASPFQLQSEMLADADFLSTVRTAIVEHHLCAEYAVYSTSKAFAMHLRTLDDSYLQSRSDDLLDVAQRVICLLRGDENDPLKHITCRVVLAADTLLPAQTMHLDRSKIAAFVLRGGAQHTHTAILIRSLGIPMVTGLGDDFDKLENGKRTMVDGDIGVVVQDPDAATLTELVQKRLYTVKEQRTLQMLKGKPAVTLHGLRVKLTVNISLPEEAKLAANNDAEGIGLFRSELLYAREENAQPSEDMLFQAYREAMMMMSGKRVIIRLLDIGVDKTLYCPEQAGEENPALGIRSVPLGIKQPEMLMRQLRALLRASGYGNLAIVLPMVVDASEVRMIKEMLSQARKALKQENRISAPQVMVGAMIETPAAAMTVDLIAAEADFISIGTNDLTQYVLVADRKNTRVSDCFNPAHPAVMRMIARTVLAAKAANVPVVVCGEAAADPNFAALWMGLQVDELSVSPVSLLKMKQAIRCLTAEDCKAALLRHLKMSHLPKALADPAANAVQEL